jgi:hypothetical protein
MVFQYFHKNLSKSGKRLPAAFQKLCANSRNLSTNWKKGYAPAVLKKPLVNSKAFGMKRPRPIKFRKKCKGVKKIVFSAPKY